MEAFVVTGIGTDIGKTVVSAVLCAALQADYWKPVQSGETENLDSGFVQRLAPGTTVIPERYVLSQPLSPHEAARIDGIALTKADFQLPALRRMTIIEGAGGLMVPINDDGLTYIDLFEDWKLPVYVVTKHYLGSINHTLLSLAALQARQIPVAGLIVNGERSEASERVYRQQFPAIPLTFIPMLETLSPESIVATAQLWKQQIG